MKRWSDFTWGVKCWFEDRPVIGGLILAVVTSAIWFGLLGFEPSNCGPAGCPPSH